MLCATEKSRADRFLLAEHRRRFIAGRGLLRIILGKYVKETPAQLEFSYGPQGKPELSDGHSTCSTSLTEKLNFNLSHSHAMALYAVSGNRCIGVDVEHLEGEHRRVERDVVQLAKRYFSPHEYTFIQSVPASQQKQAFFQRWTVKEAYVKAIGAGLGAIEQVEVSISEQDATVLLHIHADPEATNHWCAQRILSPPGYVAALVAEGPCLNSVKYFWDMFDQPIDVYRFT